LTCQRTIHTMPNGNGWQSSMKSSGEFSQLYKNS
jgi:hypothetical protein